MPSPLPFFAHLGVYTGHEISRVLLYMGTALREGSRVGEDEQLSRNTAVSALVIRYGRMLSARLLRRGADPSEIEDIKQEIFAGLLRRSDLETIDNIEGYLWRSADNYLVSQSRRMIARPVLVFGDDPTRLPTPVEEMSPERIALGRERYRIFLAALEELPERQRTIVILWKFEEFGGKEIASHLGISLSLVEKEMKAALRFLKERLS